MVSWIWPSWNILLPFLIFLVFFIWLWYRFLRISIRVPSIKVWRRTVDVILLVISWVWSFWTFIWPIRSWILQATRWSFRLKWSRNWMRILIPVIHCSINVCWIGSIIELRSLSQMIWWHHGHRLWMRLHHPWVVCNWRHLHMHWILKGLLIKWVESWLLL